MELIVYPRLSPNSQKAMRRRYKQWGHVYIYRPRRQLVARLMVELGWSEEQVLDRIRRERTFIFKYQQYF